jgi:DNA topoisomerase-1
MSPAMVLGHSAAIAASGSLASVPSGRSGRNTSPLVVIAGQSGVDRSVSDPCVYSAAMPKHLVVVESPAKARTIERYLGPDYRVLASYGHVRDLPENPGKGKFGVDVDHGFAPEYVVAEDRRKQVDAIAKAAKTADTVYLATDLDREGEAIAWHVAEAVGVPKAKARRVTFSEITQGAIREAFANPREIDTNLVDAQQARRIVDRLVGYTLSPLVSRKIKSGLSAGRVQSVAVRLVVEREREIDAFVAREYWTLRALLATEAGETFEAELVRIDGKPLEIDNGTLAEHHAESLRTLRPRVTSVATKTQKRSPAPPFTTSTLQQEASRKLGFSPKRTMSVAQRLYEGADTPDGHVGLITYMRTDSTAIAGVAMGEAREVIRERFGEPYTMPKGRVYKTKSKGAQEAHESIRPTSFRRDPESLAGTLKPEELRLYRLIWQRALASQMEAKELEITTAELAAGAYELRASATKTLFDGFARVYTEGRDEAEDDDAEGGRLPALREGDATSVADVTTTQHFTEPPPRYTEASLIKALEEYGIGRPSTYAATISTIMDRGYVCVVDRRLRPELVANMVTDFLVKYFADYVDVQFTAKMEADLDDVANGNRRWVPLLQEFFPPLREQVDQVRRNTTRGQETITDELCSEGHRMLIRFGSTGPFLACSEYPAHTETRPMPGSTPCSSGTPAAPQVGEGEPCPKCVEERREPVGQLVGKSGRFGPFVGCNRYPDCDYIRKDGAEPPAQLPFEVTCPKNGDGKLVARRARRTGNVFWGCSNYPTCDYTTNFEPIGALHDSDEGPVARKGDAFLCLKCGATIEVPGGEPGAADAAGLRLPGGPPNPEAIAPARRSGGRSSGGRGGGSRTGARGSGGTRGPRRGGGRSTRARAGT